VGGTAAGRQLHPGRLHRGPASALAGQRAVYPWCLVAGSTAASVALNVAHAPEHPAAQAVAGTPPVALLLALELLMRGARLYLRVHPLDSGPEPDTARERLRAWLAVNPSTPLTAREAAELLGVSRSRAGVLLQQERAAANGQRGGPPRPGLALPVLTGAAGCHVLT
jgi:hypothetical protein